jgi:hypothetical protein
MLARKSKLKTTGTPQQAEAGGLILHPDEVGRVSRRALLQSGLSLTAWVALDQVFCLGQARAQDAVQPSTPQRRLVWIVMNGGWDILETVDPKVASTSGIDVAFDWGLAHQLSGASGDTRLGRWLPNLAARGQDMVLVRGLAMGTTSHDAGRVYMDTGILSNSGQVNAASIPSIVASESTATIPIIQLNGGMEPQIDRGLLNPVSVVRAENLSLYQSMYPIEEDDVARSLKILEYMQGSVARITSAVGATDRLRDVDAAQTKIRDQISNGIARQLQLTPEDEAPYLGGAGMAGGRGNGLSRAFALAEKLLRNNLVTTLNMGLGGFDTHANQDRNLQPILTNLDGALAIFVDRLRAAGQLDSTLIVLYSDFGRTPKINGGNGRDHWPVGGAMLIGGGLAGGRAVGGTDDNMLARDADASSGAVVNSGGVQLNPTHLGGSVLELTLGSSYLTRRPYLSSLPALTRLRS